MLIFWPIMQKKNKLLHAVKQGKLVVSWCVCVHVFFFFFFVLFFSA